MCICDEREVKDLERNVEEMEFGKVNLEVDNAVNELNEFNEMTVQDV